jgi:glycosyltransferase involved in cell wall biosynthesis
VSIVTPSYNMARYLGETIESVLAQDYPHLEYIVMDGGSTDGTLELLRKYEGRLRYESRRDRGQADAINRGFERSSGRVFAYLNADDTYLPGAVSKAVRHLKANPACGGVYGEGYHVDEQGKILGRYPAKDFEFELLAEECFICQPAAFVWRDAFAEAGRMRLDLHFALDYDLWIRIGKRRPLLKIDDHLATSRMYRENKTLRARRRVFREAIQVVHSHFGYVSYGHMHGYASALLHKQDGFFESVPATRATYALALLLGLWKNFPQAGRFWREAAGHSRLGQRQQSQESH